MNNIFERREVIKMTSETEVQLPPNVDEPEQNSDLRIEEHNQVSQETSAINVEYKGLLWKFSLRRICLTALWLPLGALIFCYLTASMFQADDVHETHCRVYNVVPSISAITGISPQRYVWRISIAFHLGPRLLIGSLYYNYHKQRTAHITDENARTLAMQLGDACYWLNLVELFALNGVTYISNRENYFLHEKIFIIFMMASLTHMLCRARVGCIASDTVQPVRSNRLVWILLYIAILATAGLIIFFLQHRLLCKPLAFTWFAVCEYILAIANMAFHAIVVRDLPSHELQVVSPNSHEKTN